MFRQKTYWYFRPWFYQIIFLSVVMLCNHWVLFKGQKLLGNSCGIATGLLIFEYETVDFEDVPSCCIHHLATTAQKRADLAPWATPCSCSCSVLRYFIEKMFSCQLTPACIDILGYCSPCTGLYNSLCSLHSWQTTSPPYWDLSQYHSCLFFLYMPPYP